MNSAAKKKAATYKPFPIAVSSELRTSVLTTYPALQTHRNAFAYRRLMQYVMFSTFRDDVTGKVILPYTTVAALVDVPHHTQGFCAQEWLDAFSADVLPLHTSPYRYTEGQARQVAPEFAADVLTALQTERQRDTPSEKVWFADGVPVSRRKLRAACEEYEAYLLSLSQSVEPSHPAYPLVNYLLTQPQTTLRKVLNQNWPLVEAMVRDLPKDTEQGKVRREWCERLLDNLDTFRYLYYTASPNTRRIFAAGASVHQLPRDIRRAAFTGQVECDLHACQLAVVARLWEIPELQTFLESHGNIWEELLGFLGLPPSRKPILKRTVYSLIFGMGRPRLHKQLAYGDAQDDGVGTDAATRLWAHPLVAALLAARTRQHQAVWKASGSEDAFGNWLTTVWDQQSRKKNVPSVLAAVAQSYELRLMLSILPELQSQDQIYVLSWLHDGVTLHMGNVTKQARQKQRLQEAVQREASMLGIATWLEVEHIEEQQVEHIEEQQGRQAA